MAAIAQKISKKMDEMIAEKESIAINTTMWDSNLTVRTKYEEDGKDSKLLLLTEVKNVPHGLTSDDFLYFIDNWKSCITGLNTLITNVEELTPIEGVPVGKTTAELPWPMSTRVTFVARWPIIDPENKEHRLLCSSQGTEAV